ncbi:MAG: ribonuclease Z [Desulfobacterales bacterium]|nr:ribonuclease Z [Desulfobacterales bacterium]MBS3754954.1 ribonuclease Z [Desulfobacterales bacterium]
MPPIFNPRLVNDPTGDPGLFVPFFYEKRALMFDAGDISALSPKDILKITHVFITHTHMDHFIGFDRVLRICLGREKTLHVFGPEGFIANVSAKLGAYSWNLVHNYEAPLRLAVTEIHPDRLVTCRFDCRDGFAGSAPQSQSHAAPVLYREPAFTVDAALLDHDIPCVGYAVRERFSVNIRKEMLEEMGLTPGPWLYEFKQALYANRDPETEFEIPGDYCRDRRSERFLLGELARRLAIVTPGRKMAYIADAAFHEANRERMAALAENAYHLFIEAAFLEEDRDIAWRKKHLTAAQAGRIAAEAGVARFTLFHFSPRYSGRYAQFSIEADQTRYPSRLPTRQTPPGA